MSAEGEAGVDKEVSEDVDDAASHSGSLPSPGYVSISSLGEVPAAFLVGLGDLDGLGDHLQPEGQDDGTGNIRGQDDGAGGIRENRTAPEEDEVISFYYGTNDQP